MRTLHICVLLSWFLAAPCGADDLTVLATRQVQRPPHEILTAHYIDQVRAAMTERRNVVENLKTDEQIREYQQRMRTFFIEQLGGFPEKTPLNARIVGHLAGNGFRVEKVIYESRPGFPVTAALFLPETAPPYPAVLVPCGHDIKGKASEAYQRASILLAKNGIAALCYDPVGQGERSQFLPVEGVPRRPGTLEHTLMGVGCILLGTNTATWRIWDGLRSIDYLASRPDIDPQRIGCSGNSGGGTLTSYIMALDDRVLCAAPSCYLTSYERLLSTIRAQDAEQHVFAQLSFGMDHADYILMRAPKPTLICAATHDFFDIVGTWDTFRQAKRIYTRMGFAERVDLAEGDHGHGFHPPLRVAMVRWMRRWLLGIDDAIVEPDFEVFTDEQLQCTPRGQVLLEEGVRSVFDFNADLETQLAEQRRRFWKETSREKATEAVRRIAGLRPFAQLPAPGIEIVDTRARRNSRMLKLILTAPDGIPLPCLLFEPRHLTGEVYLYVHGDGKHADAFIDGPLEKLAGEGHLVLAPDLRGIGETEARTENYKAHGVPLGPDWQDFFHAYLLGKSYVGMRAEDIYTCVRFLDTRREGRPLHLVAIGEAVPPALHAAALEPDLFASIRLEEGINSWAEVVRAPLATNQLINAVHGALRTYDLPDLLTLIPVERVSVVRPVDLAKAR